MKTTEKMMTRLAGLVLLVVAAATAAPTPLPALLLERTLPTMGVYLHNLLELDQVRLSRNRSVQQLTLKSVPGLYHTRVKLGNPLKEYSLQFDTGSDVTWISCTPCNGELNITSEFYNPNTSSTCTRISCHSDPCLGAVKEEHAKCPTSDSCGYNLKYADGSATSGYYVSDTIYLDTVMGNKRVAGSSTSIFFGCSNSQSGNLPINGIIGFGQNSTVSVISQLYSRGVSAKAFSHCLKGSHDGGGILVLGEVTEEPGVVFTPLVSANNQYYNVNMKSIAVNGREVPIDSSLFTTSYSQGTFVDSGTTLAYFADGIYDPVISSIHAAIPPSSVVTFVNYGDPCFISSNRSLFPTVTLYFEEEAAMTVGPENYLLYQGQYENDTSLFCIGFQRSNMIESFPHTNILGDLVLHDKMFVYNLEKMQIGWVNRNCSLLNTTSSPVVNGSLGRRALLYYSALVAIGVAIVNSSIITLQLKFYL